MGLTLERPQTARTAKPLPQPEEVLMAWLMTQPDGSDLTAAVNMEIRRLEGYSGPHPGPNRLKELFIELGRELAVSHISGTLQ